ncbi:HlyD family type I secretion periplasmic adaptor subunit [Mesorhizobium sp. M1C.F.Ca.ET.193.01.1.1]|uniref:HlyD family type I secretion periplasmic adaptor subunit n=1 Tax=unclassified Mesorhizobium TaxID=325217 RepID=UPI000FD4002A|nr:MULTISPECIES: HlyD family type I secretion periplasmic adaptor subunit [unclassified Mesorhizobium]TGS97147.1 HlyD family type I secretion periplasmic adaptor subunit [bacterium M00.F.Ca.ET.177.01.1.1]TGQ52308.1 HlyD family type I secretion periplasmic adaptor subunit [Mesorhizobium sp. M1C.F.Ca.ET.210.01.1.1]TGQ68938.1 HlyD family type I secretion periplasmic adaptor subunit [Mesorhizobium sp. M1C.F.Ca.ET.212.01.1.1]TGR04491.1 HlyD family type I secretion periplasmic adaptor subunit [Mesorh
MRDPIEKPISPTIHLTVLVLFILFTAIVVGSYLAKTEIVARGQGKVIPAKRVQVIQPQVDGKIAEILVSEGQSVKAGDTLAVLNKTAAETEIDRISATIERQKLQASVARSIIEPLVAGDPGDVGFVKAGLAAFDHVSAGIKEKPASDALVASVLIALRDQVALSDAQRARIAGSQSVQRAKLEQTLAAQDIVSQRFMSADRLRRQGTISEFDYLDRLRERRSIDGDVLIAQRELDELARESAAASKQRASVISSALSTYQQQLSDAENALHSLEADLRAAQSRLGDLTLTAPVSGRVDNLLVFTVGGFVEAGSTMMSIVPADDAIEIEAFFDNRDVGFLQSGQPAFIKFDAFPAERFGIVHGRVTSVGADARGNVEPGKWVYAARLQLQQRGIHDTPQHEIRFAPGMTATVDVIIGERRLISYFFEPILKSIQDSFGER